MGSYVVDADTLRIAFTGQCRIKQYNWEHEADSNITPWQFRDTAVAAHTLLMRISWCNDILGLDWPGSKLRGFSTGLDPDSLFNAAFGSQQLAP